MPPKKETGKVQPKKETVRINLPPKPSAAPTIKLPTLPPGGPAGGPAAAAPAAAPGVAPAARPIGAPRAAAAAAAPAAPVRTTTAAPRMAPAPVAARPGLGKLDTILVIAAAVIGVLALLSTLNNMFEWIWKS